jgi:hypothetical protein
LDTTPRKAGDTLKLSFEVNNVGPRDGDEVVQVYFRIGELRPFKPCAQGGKWDPTKDPFASQQK